MTATPIVGSTFFGLDVSGLGNGLQTIRRRISRSTLLLEFGPRMLQLAEARPRSEGVEMKHLCRVDLPEGALERFVPADPAVMAQLLGDFCNEKRIMSHRAAVVLPPELAFQRLVQLPDSLSVEEAREYLLDPSNGVVLPFPLAQTDFDLTPLELKSLSLCDGQTMYLLSAIPDSLLEPILTMLNLAGFELQSVELGTFSTLRCIKNELLQLPESAVALLFDFSSEATLVTVVGASGPIESERLPSIREFPRFELAENARMLILERSKSLEELTVEDDRYLPISEMDLRAFDVNLKQFLEDFVERFSDLRLARVFLTGEGSAHPSLLDVLQDKLKLPVQQIRPLLTNGLRGWSLDDPLLQVGLARLVGLALGLLPADSAALPIASKPELYESDLLSDDSVSKTFDHQEPIEALIVEPNPIAPKPDLLDSIESVPEESVEKVVEEESEWPSLKLGSGEDLIDEEEKDVSEVIGEDSETAIEIAFGSSYEADIDQIIEEEMEVNEVVDEVVSKESAEAVVQEESEWPSLKLSVVGDVVVEEAIVSSDAAINKKVDNLSHHSILQGSSKDNLSVESEGGSFRAILPSKDDSSLISGLPFVQHVGMKDRHTSRKQKDNQNESPANNSNPLGELRIKEDSN